MKQCRTDCIHIEACRRFADNNTYWNSGDCPIYKSAADVVPKSEVAKKALLEFKKQIHDKAVYTNSPEIPNYVNLKVFDAILQNYINNLK